MPKDSCDLCKISIQLLTRESSDRVRNVFDVLGTVDKPSNSIHIRCFASSIGKPGPADAIRGRNTHANQCLAVRNTSEACGSAGCESLTQQLNLLENSFEVNSSDSHKSQGTTPKCSAPARSAARCVPFDSWRLWSGPHVRATEVVGIVQYHFARSSWTYVHSIGTTQRYTDSL